MSVPVPLLLHRYFLCGKSSQSTVTFSLGIRVSELNKGDQERLWAQEWTIWKQEKNEKKSQDGNLRRVKKLLQKCAIRNCPVEDNVLAIRVGLLCITGYMQKGKDYIIREPVKNYLADFVR